MHTFHNPLVQADATPRDEYAEVLIIGAGFAGLGMGAQLRRHDRKDFLIIERASEVGGTWRDNVYPGAACDVPSHLYSFSFAQNPHWSAYYSPGPEIQQYIRKVAHDEGLYPHIRFNANMEDARWDDLGEQWVVRTPRGNYTGRYLITGTGHLADPRLPEIPGLDAFTGRVFHSARWDETADLSGKRVAVVGTGASAIQIVPELAKIVDELVVFQRTPAWVRPRIIRPYSAAAQRMFERAPEAMQQERDDIFWSAETSYAARRGVPAALEVITREALDNLARAIDDPELRQKLTPQYTPGCKRILTSNDYYPSFTRPNVRLEASALASVQGSTLVGASGARHDVDVIVLCTGFEAAQPPFAHHIRDAEGKTLAEYWSTGMAAFDSTAVAGFPNLFVINGPNTSLGHNSIVYMIESQVQYILEALDYAEAQNIRSIVPSGPAQDEYVEKLQERAATTVWLQDGGCNSWYVDPRSGKLTLIWPDYAYDFRARNGHFTGDGFLSRHQGSETPLMAGHLQSSSTKVV